MKTNNEVEELLSIQLNVKEGYFYFSRWYREREIIFTITGFSYVELQGVLNLQLISISMVLCNPILYVCQTHP